MPSATVHLDDTYFASLCTTCRALNLRPDTFLQTGYRHPSTLRYTSTFIEFSSSTTEDANSILYTIYAQGEKLEDYIDGETNEDEYRHCLDKRLPASAQHHRFNDDDGVPEWTVPDKKCVLGSLRDLRLRANSGCNFCRFVVDASQVVEPYDSATTTELGSGSGSGSGSSNAHTTSSNSNGKFTVGEDAKCKVSFHFREMVGNMSSENKNPVAAASVDVSHALSPSPGHTDDGKILTEEDRTARTHGFYEATISFGADASIDILPVVAHESELSWFGGRPVKPLIDHRLVKHWLSQCQTQHPGCIQNKDKIDLSLIKTLRVIDVTRWCLTEIDFSASPFIALSYVWGDAPTLKVTRQNAKELYQPGALSAARAKEIPNTTRDAMQFVRDMGLQYLWTDSLCILQDDATEMIPQLRRMDLIYAGALFTIVAADGKDVAAGLSGSHAERPRKPPSLFRYSDELHFMLDPKPVTKVLLDCPWTQRLWTLQEAWMSTRLLIFTEHGVHFTCSSLLWSENRQDLSEQEHPPWTHFHEPYFNFRAEITLEMPNATSSPQPSQPRELFSLEQWISFAEESSQRKLTYEWDLENATAGLMYQLETLYQMRSMYGLPEAVLEEALLWSPMTHTGVRRRKTKDGSDLYPTWSWMGWVGEISWPGGYTHAAEVETRAETEIEPELESHEGSKVDILKLSDLTEKPERLSITGSPSTSRDSKKTFPYLLVQSRSLVLYIDNHHDVPEHIKELQPFAWFVHRLGEGDQQPVHCGWTKPTNLTSAPTAVGSILFDDMSMTATRAHALQCHLVQIRSEPQQLEDGDYAGQLFYEVLAVKHVETLDDGTVLAERIGHGRVLLQEARELWSRMKTILR